MHYRALLSEIRACALSCGRDPASISLIAVTKGRSLEEVKTLYDEGCRQFGESRLHEALEKSSALPSDINWHLIGSLQSKKASQAVGSFSLIHSVDSEKLAGKLCRAAEKEGRKETVLLQINTSREASKHGFSPEALFESFERLNRLSFLEIEGLMTMAPLTKDSSLIRSSFSRLRELGAVLGLKQLSMGMSGDWRLAVEEGATLLRIGSLFFGD